MCKLNKWVTERTNRSVGADISAKKMVCCILCMFAKVKNANNTRFYMHSGNVELMVTKLPENGWRRCTTAVAIQSMSLFLSLWFSLYTHKLSHLFAFVILVVTCLVHTQTT